MWYPALPVSEACASGDQVSEGDPLMAELRLGETAAIRLVYRQHHEAVRAFGRRLLSVEADADELVQDTFVALPKALKNFRGECTLRTFLFSIAAQKSRNYLRGRRRRSSLLQGLLGAAGFSSPKRLPDEILDAGMLANRLRAAMDELTDDQRLAFVLVEIEERSSAEAGDILGVPPSTVRARASAARRKLQELLGEETP